MSDRALRDAAIRALMETGLTGAEIAALQRRDFDEWLTALIRIDRAWELDDATSYALESYVDTLPDPQPDCRLFPLSPRRVREIGARR